MDQNTSATKIGYISACIAGDHRYTSRIEVLLEGDKVHVVFSENGAVGGMDGPGGSTPFAEKNRKTVKATTKDVVNAIKASMDNVIKTYGKPSKNFVWVGIKARGLSQKLASEALAFAQGDDDSDDVEGDSEA